MFCPVGGDVLAKVLAHWPAQTIVPLAA